MWWHLKGPYIINEKIGIGTVSSIENIVIKKQLSNPAIIVLGEVVKHRQRVLEIQEKYTRELVL